MFFHNFLDIFRCSLFAQFGAIFCINVGVILVWIWHKNFRLFDDDFLIISWCVFRRLLAPKMIHLGVPLAHLWRPKVYQKSYFSQPCFLASRAHAPRTWRRPARFSRAQRHFLERASMRETQVPLLVLVPERKPQTTDRSVHATTPSAQLSTNAWRRRAPSWVVARPTPIQLELLHVRLYVCDQRLTYMWSL